MYPRARLDTLSDGIFSVAMTLLVLDLRLPEEFHPRDGRELLDGLFALTPKFFPYAISFLVLGLRWLSSVQVRSKAEHAGRHYVWLWLIYHLLITCVPFSTLVVGRFASLAPSIWLYSFNTALIALVSLGMLATLPQIERDAHLRDRKVSIALLFASSVLAIAWSLFNPRQALWAFLLTALAPAATRWFARGKARAAPAIE